ncbi:hypothetical protein KM043_001361 [Ampulex compressa]|nr:hypothetical protein KM043_001361 [Ampulex compressa]
MLVLYETRFKETGSQTNLYPWIYTSVDPEKTGNKNFIIFHIPAYGIHENSRNDPEMQQHYRTVSYFLPVGSIITLGSVILLMILFKRHPDMVVAIVAAILGVTIIFLTVISLNHKPIYV